MTEQTRCKNTETLLKGIVARLSGRDELKSVNYTITISSKNKVTMTPIVYVYPNRYRRCESDKSDIVSFILETQLANRGNRSFVPGQYTYQSSFDGKRRQWVRIK